MEHDCSSREQTKGKKGIYEKVVLFSQTEWSNQNSQRCFQLASDEFGFDATNTLSTLYRGEFAAWKFVFHLIKPSLDTSVCKG